MDKLAMLRGYFVGFPWEEEFECETCGCWVVFGTVYCQSCGADLRFQPLVADEKEETGLSVSPFQLKLPSF